METADEVRHILTYLHGYFAMFRAQDGQWGKLASSKAFEKLPETSALRKIADHTHQTVQYLSRKLSHYSGSLQEANHLDQLRAMLQRLSEPADHADLIRDAKTEVLKSSQIELRETIIARHEHQVECFEGLRRLLVNLTAPS